ncbi:MAG: SpoIIIAH-like family protein [Clostridia bacterium]|nr:SpoIIIAH-like family protein [Clostridia bacterium]
MIVMKRKQIMIVSIAALVAIAGYLNWSYDKAPETAENFGEVKLVSNQGSEAVQEENDFFSEARLEREIGRSQSVASLQGIMQDANSSAEARKGAEEEMLSIATLSEKESTAENLLRAKGFEDVVIYISDGKVTAVVKTKGLQSEDVAKIVDVITAQTGIPASDINIVESA